MTSTLLPQCNLLFSSTPLEGPEQMALDDLLLQIGTKPLLRLYCWKKPCVTFGYFQQWSLVREIFPQQQIVRRSTGGGCVVHGSDITFSFILPYDKSLKKPSPLWLYETLHKAVADVLKEVSIITSFAPAEKHLSPACCFTAPVLYDLLWNKKKILGGAQRRHRGNLLYQGSLLLSLPTLKGESCINIHDKVKDFFYKLASHLSQEVTIIEEKPHWLLEAAALAATQYRSDSWTKKR